MLTIKITAGDRGDPSVGISPNSWDLIVPIEDALDDSYSRQPLEDIKTSQRLTELKSAFAEFYSEWCERCDYTEHTMLKNGDPL